MGVLGGVGHGFVGRLGSPGAVLHLAQNAVEVLRALVENGQRAHARLRGAPQLIKSGGIAAYAVADDSQDIAQGRAVLCERGKGLSRLLLEDPRHLGAGITQLTEHGIDLCPRLRCGRTAGGEHRIGGTQVVHLHIIGGGQGNDTAHGLGQLIHAGLALVLGGDEDVGDFPGLRGGQAIGVDGGCEHVHGGFGLRETACCQLSRLRHSLHCRGSIYTGGDGRVGGLRNGRGGLPRLIGEVDDLCFDLIHGGGRGIRDSGHLGDGGLKALSGGGAVH